METAQKSPVDQHFPSKLKATYPETKLVSESSYYTIYKAESQDHGEAHTIRVLNLSSDLVLKNYSAAATLFIQEALYLANHVNGTFESIIVESFQIENEKIAFATQPYRTLATLKQKQGSRLSLDLDKLLKDLIANVNFLHLNMKLANINIHPENIYSIKDSDAYFLGDWGAAKPIQTGYIPRNSSELIRLSSELRVPKTAAQEIHKLALLALELSGLGLEDYGELLEIRDEFKYISFLEVIANKLEKLKLSKALQSLIVRMLQETYNSDALTKKFIEERSESIKLQLRNSEIMRKSLIGQQDESLSPQAIFEIYERIFEVANDELGKAVTTTRNGRRSANNVQDYVKLCEEFLEATAKILSDAQTEVLKDMQIDSKEFTAKVANYIREGNEEVNLIHSMIPQKISLSVPAAKTMDLESLKLLLQEEIEFVNKNASLLKPFIKDIESSELAAFIVKSRINDYINLKFRIEEEDVLAQLQTEESLADLEVKILMSQFQEALSKVTPSRDSYIF